MILKLSPNLQNPKMPKKFPNQIIINLANKCNGNCVFCEYPHIEEKRGEMSQTLFKDIIKDCKENQDKLDLIQFSGFGELFVFSDAISFLRIIDRELSSVRIKVKSNGSINFEQAKKIIREDLIDEISFSIDGGNKNSAETTVGWTGYDFQDIVNNINRFIDLKEKYDSDIAVNVTFTLSPYNFNSIREFIRKWKFKNVEIRMSGVNNLAGNLFDLKERDKPEDGDLRYCPFPFEGMWIMSDGTVALCYHDAYAECKIGDLTQESVLEVWNCNKIKKIRKKMKERKWSELKLCNNCCDLSQSYESLDYLDTIREKYMDLAEQNAPRKIEYDELNDQKRKELHTLFNISSLEHYLKLKDSRLSNAFHYFEELYVGRENIGNSLLFRFISRLGEEIKRGRSLKELVS